MIRRQTQQKELVLSAVRTLGNHATAEEIYERVIAEQPSVSRGTVYRNLGILAEEGLVLRVEVPGAADHYDHNTFPHYHVRCVRCGRVCDVQMSEMTDLREKLEACCGFDVLGYEVLFKGVCPDCK